MDFLQLPNPALQYVRCVTPKMLSKLEKAGAGLHVSRLVNDNDTQHASAVSIFFLRELAQ